MGKVFEITRQQKKIKVRVVEEYTVIDDKVAAPGDLEVVDGLVGEKYRIQYDAAKAGYDLSDELLGKMNRAKDGR